MGEFLHWGSDFDELLAVVAIGLDPIWSSKIADRPNDETQLHNQPDASKIMTRQLEIAKQEAQ
jgi:hypothetical protein